MNNHEQGKRIICSDNGRYFLSGIYDEDILETIDKFGSISARDAENPNKWLSISIRNGKLHAEEEQ